MAQTAQVAQVVQMSPATTTKVGSGIEGKDEARNGGNDDSSASNNICETKLKIRRR